MFAVFVLVFSPRLIPSVLSDPDTSWHIAAGSLIRTLGHLPATDSWSFTTQGTPWYNLAWGFDVLASLLYQWGGLDLLAWVAVISCAGLLAWVARQSVLRSGSYTASFLILLLCSTLMLQGVTMRPHLFSFALMLAFLHLLQRAEFDAVRQRSLLWQLPLLMAAWVNLHGAFLTGFITIGAYGLSALLDRRKETFTRLTWIVGLSLLATCFNPEGVQIYYGAWRTLGGAMTAYIHEWRPPPLHPKEMLSWFLLLFIACFSVANPRLTLTEKILSLLWLMLALNSRRYILFAALALSPVLALSLHDAWQRSRWAGTLARYEQDIVGALAKQNSGRIALALATLCSLALIVAVSGRFIWKDGITFRSLDLPAQEIEYALQHYPNARMLNHYDYGGYLLLMANGKLRPFIDGRAETAYPDALIEDYLRFQNFEKDWQALLTKYQPDLILVPIGMKQSHQLAALAGWRLAYRGQQAELYARETKTRPFPAR